MRENLNLSEDQEEIAAYGFEMILHNFLTLGAVILAGWLLGCLPAALAATFAASVLRALSGGAHSESAANCSLISVVLAVLIGKSAIVIGSQVLLPAIIAVVLFISLISLKVIWVLAPVDSPAKPITNEIHRKNLRVLSLVAVTIISVVQLSLTILNPGFFAPYALAVSLGIAWQTFTLTVTGNRFSKRIDYLINKIKRR
jgi:accessory gene regulator B